MNLLKKLAEKLAKTDFVRKAIEERADLSAFKERPPKQHIIRNIIGVSLIIFSYIIGWPAVIFLGAVSIYMGEPLVVIIGGPVVYGLSHLVFIAGMYLAGARYSMIFLRWAVRVVIEKIIGSHDKSSSDNPAMKISSTDNK